VYSAGVIAVAKKQNLSQSQHQYGETLISMLLVITSGIVAAIAGTVAATITTRKVATTAFLYSQRNILKVGLHTRTRTNSRKDQYTSLFTKMVANKRKHRQTNKHTSSINNTLNIQYVHSQNITVLTKCIDRNFVFTNKFLTSFFNI